MASEHLSVRERQVLELASAGLTNRQVAMQLELTVHAVKFHLAGVYRKLGVPNRTAATAVYLGILRDATPENGREPIAD